MSNKGMLKIPDGNYGVIKESLLRIQITAYKDSELGKKLLSLKEKEVLV